MKKITQALCLLLLFVQQAVAAVEAKFIEGKDYQRAPQDIANNPLVQELNKQSNGKVQVMEFFSYGCHWCYQLDPYVERYRKTLPAHVEFQRIPVEFQPAWHALGKAFYAAGDLNALPQIHGPLFEAIQTEKVTDASPATLKNFFVARGVKAEDFDKTFNSFDVERKQKWALSISRAFKITAIPVVIVHGPAGTFVTSVKMAGSEANVVKVVDHLVKQENNTKPIPAQIKK